MSKILERPGLWRLKNQVAAFSRFFASTPANSAAAMHGTISQMHAHCSAPASFPPALWRSSEVQEVLGPAAELQAQSSFVRRLRK